MALLSIRTRPRNLGRDEVVGLASYRYFRSKNMTIEETLKAREKTHGEYTKVAHAWYKLREEMIMGESCGYLELEKAAETGFAGAVPLCALEMILLKVARICNGDPYHIDHWRDIQGYAKLVEDSLTRSPMEVTGSPPPEGATVTFVKNEADRKAFMEAE